MDHAGLWHHGQRGGGAAAADERQPPHACICAGGRGKPGRSRGGILYQSFPRGASQICGEEARAADCLYRGAEVGDGAPRIVGGDLQTIMAGLACGEPNILSWDILRNHVSAFVSCPDWVSARGMRMLGAPVKGDPRVVSGESGAVGMGLLSAVMKDAGYEELRKALELDQSSQVLLFSTEGDTDPVQYQRIVWDGEYPSNE